MSKIAIVTGGGSGYGTGIAEALKREGAEVWITGRTESKLAEVSKRLGVHYVQADVTSPEDWDRVFDTVLRQAGTVDYLINNAGGGIKNAPLDQLTDEEIMECINLNLTGVFFGCRRAAKIMKEKKTGTIINISSVVAVQAWPGWSAYSAAKGGLEQLTKCLYAELRAAGARATLITPSWGQTDFRTNAQLPGQPAEILDKTMKGIELGDLVSYICNMPEHLWVQEITVWPTVQEVVPL